MNNMYDILAKINLLEGKGSKPDFLDLDKDGDTGETMKQASQQAKQVKEGDEGFTQADYDKIARKKRHLMMLNRNLEPEDAEEMAAQKLGYDYDEVLSWVNAEGDEVKEGSTGDYSAKKARAGKDIGKPGKQFSKIAADAAKRYGSKERGEKVAGAVLAKLRAKESIGEGDDIQEPRHPQELDYQQGPEDDEQYRRHHGLNDPDRRRERQLRATDYKTLDRLERQAVDRAKQIDEEPNEGNEFSGELAKAKATGQKEFEVDGKTYPVKESRRKHLALIREAATETRSIKIYHDREYDEFTVCLGQDGTVRRMFAERRSQAMDIAREWLSEGRNDPSPLDDPITRFRKKFAPSVMRDPEARSELSKLDTEYGERRKTAYGRGEEEGDNDEEGGKKDKPAGEKRGRGRPRKYSADKPRQERVTARSRKKDRTAWSADRKKMREDGILEDYDEDEYDEEGEMAQSQARTIEDAAEELQSILGADENLPEWVQKKISLAMDYIDTARDYMKANRPQEEPMVAEKAVSKAQRKAAGIAYAAKKGDIPKSELRGASKEMAKMKSGELKKFAKTKEKDLPEKKTEEVEETTTAGNVAPAAEAPKGGKKGSMQFGKGVYETRLAEQFAQEIESIMNEGLDVSVTANADGSNTVSVTGKDVSPDVLMDLLKMAGMSGSREEVYQPIRVATGSNDISGMLDTLDDIAGGDQDQADVMVPEQEMCEVCGGHEGMHEAGCGRGMTMEADLANSADNTEIMDTDYMVDELAGGLNGPKLHTNPNNPGDNPLAMRSLGAKSSPNLNLGAMAEEIRQEKENHLIELYKRIS